jgi:hypothetical protein
MEENRVHDSKSEFISEQPVFESRFVLWLKSPSRIDGLER